MHSNTIKLGPKRAPHRSLLRATGAIRDQSDWHKPFVAVCNSHIDIIPGHAHLQEFGRLVKQAVRDAGARVRLRRRRRRGRISACPRVQ